MVVEAVGGMVPILHHTNDYTSDYIFAERSLVYDKALQYPVMDRWDGDVSSTMKSIRVWGGEKEIKTKFENGR